MNVSELVESVMRAGGVLKLEGDNVKCWLPKEVVYLAGELRGQKLELLAALRTGGGRVANFPHCPRCTGYALYREHNQGDYECLTCGLMGIEEQQARRVM